jgi:hypothetical protein
MLALAFSVWQAGAGHGSYISAKLLFPFAMLTVIPVGRLTVMSLVLALAQWPAYCAIIGSRSGRARQNVVLGLVAIHAAGVFACAAFVSKDVFP